MSLKDDFLEALNSVKKDLFSGSNGTASEDEDIEAAGTGNESEQTLDSDSEYASPLETADVNLPEQTLGHESFSFFSEPDTVTGNTDNTEDGSLSGGAYYNREIDSAGHTPDNTAESGDYTQDTSDTAIESYNGNGRVYDFDRTDFYSDDKTIISKNTIIRGALQTDDSIRLLGQVLGDIDCKSNIVIAGKVRGNTSAANAYVMDAQVDGSLQCDDVVSVSSDAWITGDIRAQQAEIDGKIKGNLNIRHAVSIGSTSTIIGDISTDELEVKRGAFVNGNVMMFTPARDVLDKFDHFDDFEK